MTTVDNINNLLNNMNNYDKDRRFMAANDIVNEVVKRVNNKDINYYNGLIINRRISILDNNIQKRICDAFIKQLDDTSIDVRSNAIKGLNNIILIFNDILIKDVMNTLLTRITSSSSSTSSTCNLNNNNNNNNTSHDNISMMNGSSSDVYTGSLKYIITNLPNNISIINIIISSKIIEKLINIITNDNIIDNNIIEESIEIMTKVIEKISIIIIDIAAADNDNERFISDTNILNNILHNDSLCNRIMNIILSNNNKDCIKNKCCICMAYICYIILLTNNKEGYNYLDNIINIIILSYKNINTSSSSSSSNNNTSSLIQLVNNIARLINGNILMKYIPSILPILLNILDDNIDITIDDNNNVKINNNILEDNIIYNNNDYDNSNCDNIEKALLTFGIFINKCGINNINNVYISYIIKIITMKLIIYDPNYYYGDDNDDDEEGKDDIMENEDNENYEVDDDEYYDNDEDDDDDSWKVRKGSINVINNIINVLKITHNDNTTKELIYYKIYDFIKYVLKGFSMILSKRCCKERDNNVKLEAIKAYKGLLNTIKDIIYILGYFIVYDSNNNNDDDDILETLINSDSKILCKDDNIINMFNNNDININNIIINTVLNYINITLPIIMNGCIYDNIIIKNNNNKVSSIINKSTTTIERVRETVIELILEITNISNNSNNININNDNNNIRKVHNIINNIILKSFIIIKYNNTSSIALKLLKLCENNIIKEYEEKEERQRKRDKGYGYTTLINIDYIIYILNSIIGLINGVDDNDNNNTNNIILIMNLLPINDVLSIISNIIRVLINNNSYHNNKVLMIILKLYNKYISKISIVNYINNNTQLLYDDNGINDYECILNNIILLMDNHNNNIDINILEQLVECFITQVKYYYNIIINNNNNKILSILRHGINIYIKYMDYNNTNTSSDDGGSSRIKDNIIFIESINKLFIIDNNGYNNILLSYEVINNIIMILCNNCNYYINNKDNMSYNNKQSINCVLTLLYYLTHKHHKHHHHHHQLEKVVIKEKHDDDEDKSLSPFYDSNLWNDSIIPNINRLLLSITNDNDYTIIDNIFKVLCNGIRIGILSDDDNNNILDILYNNICNTIINLSNIFDISKLCYLNKFISLLSYYSTTTSTTTSSGSSSSSSKLLDDYITRILLIKIVDDEFGKDNDDYDYNDGSDLCCYYYKDNNKLIINNISVILSLLLINRQSSIISNSNNNIISILKGGQYNNNDNNNILSNTPSLLYNLLVNDYIFKGKCDNNNINIKLVLLLTINKCFYYNNNEIIKDDDIKDIISLCIKIINNNSNIKLIDDICANIIGTCCYYSLQNNNKGNDDNNNIISYIIHNITITSSSSSSYSNNNKVNHYLLLSLNIILNNILLDDIITHKRGQQQQQQQQQQNDNTNNNNKFEIPLTLINNIFNTLITLINEDDGLQQEERHNEYYNIKEDISKCISILLLIEPSIFSINNIIIEKDSVNNNINIIYIIISSIKYALLLYKQHYGSNNSIILHNASNGREGGVSSCSYYDNRINNTIIDDIIVNRNLRLLTKVDKRRGGDDDDEYNYGSIGSVKIDYNNIILLINELKYIIKYTLINNDYDYKLHELTLDIISMLLEYKDVINIRINNNIITIIRINHILFSNINDVNMILCEINKKSDMNKSLIKEVDLGPFKHKRDEGLSLRKASYRCLKSLLSNISIIEILQEAYDDDDSTFLNNNIITDILIKGFQDDDGDIQLICCDIIISLLTTTTIRRRGGYYFKLIIINNIKNIIETMDKSINKLLKEIHQKYNKKNNNNRTEREREGEGIAIEYNNKIINKLKCYKMVINTLISLIIEYTNIKEINNDINIFYDIVKRLNSDPYWVKIA